MLADDDIIHLMKTHKDQIPSFEEWMSRQYKYIPIWKTYSEMIAVLGKELSDKILTDTGKIYDNIIVHIEKTFRVKAFAYESTPVIKFIKKGQVYIYYDEERIVDITQLGMPERHNDYENRIFKYIFVEKCLFEPERAVTKKDIIQEVMHFVAGYQKP